MQMTPLRQANNQLAAAWQEANRAGDIGKARRISVAWRAVEALVEEEELAGRPTDEADQAA